MYSMLVFEHQSNCKSDTCEVTATVELKASNLSCIIPKGHQCMYNLIQEKVFLERVKPMCR